MEINELQPGSPIELCYLHSDEEKNSKSTSENIFISTLFDITKKGDIVFHMPTRQGRLVSLPLNIEYNLIIGTPQSGMYSVDGLLTNRGKIENFPVYVFHPNTVLTKVQRRNYYRLPCLISATATPISEEQAQEASPYELEDLIESRGYDAFTCKANIVDISGGGARFTCPNDVMASGFVFLRFALKMPQGDYNIRIAAQKISTEFKRESGNYENRVKFLFNDLDERETIIKYIFEEERRIRKRGSGIKNV